MPDRDARSRCQIQMQDLYIPDPVGPLETIESALWQNQSATLDHQKRAFGQKFEAYWSQPDDIFFESAITVLRKRLAVRAVISDAHFPVLLSTVIRSRIQVEPATLLIPITIYLIRYGGGVVRYSVPEWLLYLINVRSGFQCLRSTFLFPLLQCNKSSMIIINILAINYLLAWELRTWWRCSSRGTPVCVCVCVCE